MPKATLSFDLPEEQREYMTALCGAGWKNVVRELSLFLREKLELGYQYKTGDEALGAAQRVLWEACRDSDLDPGE
jgi:hypothetical protein